MEIDDTIDAALDDMPYNTVDDRRKVYIRAVNIYIQMEEPYYPGICELIDALCGNYSSPAMIDIENLFPEIYAQRPVFPYSIYWWPEDEKQQRIDALNKAIELCNLNMTHPDSAESCTKNS